MNKKEQNSEVGEKREEIKASATKSRSTNFMGLPAGTGITLELDYRCKVPNGRKEQRKLPF